MPAPPSPAEIIDDPLKNVISAFRNNTEASKTKEALVDQNNDPVTDFTGSLAEIIIPNIKVRASL
jgi:hypothetical protein